MSEWDKLDEALEDMKRSFHDALDDIVGTQKVVCPHCKRLERLFRETNILSDHVYVDPPDSLDPNDIVLCPGSGTVIDILEGE